ncbi:MAG: basic secretory protein-like protein [Thermoguttaceae bacterium]
MTPDLPDDMTVTVTQTGMTPANIVVMQGDKKWETTSGKWNTLPAEARRFAQKLHWHDVPLKIEVDSSESPDSENWAQLAAATAEKWFPKLVIMLDGDEYKPTEHVRFVFKKMDGVAFASGNNITISEEWIKRHPDDLGMVVHELIHLVQSYRSPVPGWVTEGIADYIRFFQYEPGKVGVRVNPDKHKYTDSYRITASFFDWIVRTKNPDFIYQLNDICRRAQYNQETFSLLTGQSLDDLWKDYADSLR